MPVNPKLEANSKVRLASPRAFQEAADVLGSGGLVIAPTRTNYNLICDPRNTAAIQRVFDIKKRTKFGPLLILISHIEDALRFGELPANYHVDQLNSIWPSEITIIMNKRFPFPSQLTLGLETLGISCQGESGVNEVIKAFGFPVAATSANISGQGDIFVDLDKAILDLGDAVDLIIDSGKASQAALSDNPDKSNSIIDITFDKPYLVRRGLVTVETIKRSFPNLEVDIDKYKARLQARVEVIAR